MLFRLAFTGGLEVREGEVDKHLCTYKNLSGLPRSSSLRWPKGQGVVLEPVCIPSGSGWSRGQSSEAPEGTTGMWAGGVLQLPPLPGPTTHKHCHPKPRASLTLGSWTSESGKTPVQVLFALLQKPQHQDGCRRELPAGPALPCQQREAQGSALGPSLSREVGSTQDGKCHREDTEFPCVFEQHKG